MIGLRALFGAGVLLGVVTHGSTVAAQEEIVFKKVRGARELKISRCELVDGISRFVVSRKGKHLAPAARYRRSGSTLTRRYKFFACNRSEDGTATLLVKTALAAEAEELSFTEASFPEQDESGLARVCPNGSQRVGGGVLYKPAADASDSRSGKPVVLLQGSNKTRTSSLSIYSSAGESICTFSFKASSIPGVNGGSDHYFSGWTGGCGKTASQLAESARGSIYIGWKGGKCLGPVNPRSRTGAIG